MYQEPYIIIERTEVDLKKFINIKDSSTSFKIYGFFFIAIIVEGAVFLGLALDDSWIPMLKEALDDYHDKKIDTNKLKQQLKELENTFHQQNQNLQQLKSRLET